MSGGSDRRATSGQDAREVLDSELLDVHGKQVTLRAQLRPKALLVVFLRHFG